VTAFEALPKRLIDTHWRDVATRLKVQEGTKEAKRLCGHFDPSA